MHVWQLLRPPDTLFPRCASEGTFSRRPCGPGGAALATRERPWMLTRQPARWKGRLGRVKLHPGSAAYQGNLGDGAGGGDVLPDAATQQAWQRGTLRGMLTFMAPALAIPMADPLMSLVDTVCLGQFAGTAELAAIGPAVVVLAFTQYAFQALQIATLRCVVGMQQRLQCQHALAKHCCSFSLCEGRCLASQ